MIDNMPSSREQVLHRSIRDMNFKLYPAKNERSILDAILSEARLVAGAEAGSLYLALNGHLKIVAVHNNRMDASDIDRHLMGQSIPVSMESLVGLVAISGQAMNIPDTHHLPTGAPFRINRDLDAKTGYHADSILAVPLCGPDREQIGVMELFNHHDADGRPCPFEQDALEAITTLASTAAVVLCHEFLRQRLRNAHLDTILCLSAVAEYRDSDTAQHIRRVSRCSELIAAEMGVSAEEAAIVRYASPMHDVGKVGIPDAILLKPGPLTDGEQEVMRRHTLLGAEILGSIDDPIFSAAREIALDHHERWDGLGYPAGLKGTDIPLNARIVGLVDVFDAVVSRRCYKEACSLSTALAILNQDSGKHFDPDAVRSFLRVLNEVLKSYPGLAAA